MNQLVRVDTSSKSALVSAAGNRAEILFLEFFSTEIRNPNTRRAYRHAVREFLTWCADAGVSSIASVRPLHVAGWRETQLRTFSASTVKQQLAAIRHLFDWLVAGQVIPVNPTSLVHVSSHSVRVCKTPVLDPAEARTLLHNIDVGTQSGLRDRALIGLMAYSSAWIGAVIGMRVEDVYRRNGRLWVRLREKGAKARTLLCDCPLDEYLTTYLDAASLREDPEGPLFRTIGRGTGLLTCTPLPQSNAWAMIKRRRAAARIETRSETIISSQWKLRFVEQRRRRGKGRQ